MTPPVAWAFLPLQNTFDLAIVPKAPIIPANSTALIRVGVLAVPTNAVFEFKGSVTIDENGSFNIQESGTLIVST